MKYDIGTLIQDNVYPQDGLAIVIGHLGDYGYVLYSLQTGRTDSYDRDSVDNECEKIQEDK